MNLSTHAAICMMQALYPSTHMQCPVGVLNERDEDREDHVDEERHKDVEVDFGEDVNKYRRIGCQAICGKHVITIDEGEKTFGCDEKCTKLQEKHNFDV